MPTLAEVLRKGTRAEDAAERVARRFARNDAAGRRGALTVFDLASAEDIP